MFSWGQNKFEGSISDSQGTLEASINGRGTGFHFSTLYLVTLGNNPTSLPNWNLLLFWGLWDAGHLLSWKLEAGSAENQDLALLAGLSGSSQEEKVLLSLQPRRENGFIFHSKSTEVDYFLSIPF